MNDLVQACAGWLESVAKKIQRNGGAIGVGHTDDPAPDTIEFTYSGETFDAAERLRIIAKIGADDRAYFIARPFSGERAGQDSQQWYAEMRDRRNGGGVGKAITDYDPLGE
jgi:hypothetical protein